MRKANTIKFTIYFLLFAIILYFPKIRNYHPIHD